jgi:hypothetical protein
MKPSRTAVLARGIAAAVAMALAALAIPGCDHDSGKDKVPKPEKIDVGWLPLPPTAPTAADGSVIPGGCAHATGCLSPDDTGIAEGPSYLKDGKHVVLPVTFAGAPAGSVYTGDQVIVIKTEKNATFANGDAWKCITCGIPDANQAGHNAAFDHPQPFHDGRRVLLGANILDCGDHAVTDDACTAQATHIYPIWWQVTADGSGAGGSMRELRLNNDDSTLGWSHLSFGAAGISQFAYVGRLKYNAAPTTGTPLVARYELESVYRLYGTKPEDEAFYPDPQKPGDLIFNALSPHMGELRGFTSDGREVIGINSAAESGHVDLFATDLATGAMRRLTATEYTDPIKMSPDDQWFVDLDVRVSERSMFIGGMDGLPPLTDLVTIALVSEVRNNRNRRFFQPMLVDHKGQRGDYIGQQINAGNDDAGSGGISDPNWNARADPAWSPDGTKIVYWQALVSPPSCGGNDQPACPASTEPGGRRTRLMIADLVDRRPGAPKPAAAIPAVGSWASAYVPGAADPTRYATPTAGTFTLRGTSKGSATVTFERNLPGNVLSAVSVQYHDFANDCRIFNGSEEVELHPTSLFTSYVDWTSDIAMSGCETGTKITRNASGDKGTMSMSSNANVFEATGTLTTTLGTKVYDQPANDN